MVRELIDLFQRSKTHNANMFEDDYAFKEGIYIRLLLDQPLEKNHLEKQMMVVSKKGEVTNFEGNEIEVEQKKWFQWRDKNGEVLDNDANKYLDFPARLIASVIPCAFFMKKDVMFGVKPVGGKKEILTPATIKGRIGSYYDEKLTSLGVLEQWKKLVPNKATMNFEEAYPMLISYLQSEERKHFVEECKAWLLNFLEPLMEWIGQQKFGNYVRLFFDYENKEKSELLERNWELEYQLYVLPKLFNKNDFNVIVDNEIYGYPMFENSLNADKPFKKGMDRFTNVPILSSLEAMGKQKEFYDWLKGKPYFRPIMLTELTQQTEAGIRGKRYILKNKDGIEEMDYIPFDEQETFTLPIPNYLYVSFSSGKLPISLIQGKEEFRKYIHRLFFNFKIGDNYLKEEAKQKGREFTSEMSSRFYQMRHGLFDFFEKDYEETWKKGFTTPMRYLLFQLLKRPNVTYFDLISAFHIYLAMRERWEDEGVKKLKSFTSHFYEEKLPAFKENPEVYKIDNDNEFFYVAGQLATYLVSKSKRGEKNYEILEPVLRSKTVSRLLEELKSLFVLYKHELKMTHKTFNAIYQAIILYALEEELGKEKVAGTNQDWLLAGILGKNLFYMKKEEVAHDNVQ